jgi:hypothetical protein
MFVVGHINITLEFIKAGDTECAEMTRLNDSNMVALFGVKFITEFAIDFFQQIF